MRRAEIHRGELQDLKKKLNELLPPGTPLERKEKVKRDRPYVPTIKETFPDWMKDRSLLPRKPPGR